MHTRRRCCTRSHCRVATHPAVVSSGMLWTVLCSQLLGSPEEAGAEVRVRDGLEDELLAGDKQSADWDERRTNGSNGYHDDDDDDDMR